MSSFWLSAIGLLIGAWHVIQAWRARGTGHIVLGALDGALLRGKWLPWKSRLAGGAVVVVLAVVAVAMSLLTHPLGGESFKISVPAGWVDLSENAPASAAAQLGLDVNGLRARARGAAAFAATVDEGRVTSFEARIAQGRWEPSLDRLRQSSIDNFEGVEQLTGVKPEFSDFELLDVKGIVCGKYKATLRFPDRTIYSLTYVLPAPDSRAFLIYSADARDFDRHVGDFTDVVQHAWTAPSKTPSLPFPPEYLPLGGLVIDAILTFVCAGAPRPVPIDDDDDDDMKPKRPRRRKKSKARGAPTGEAA